MIELNCAYIYTTESAIFITVFNNDDDGCQFVNTKHPWMLVAHSGESFCQMISKGTHIHREMHNKKEREREYG